MKKIVIIGSPGAGKSTFAQALGNVLQIEIFHLDRYFWKLGWKEYPRETRIEIQQQLVKEKDQWIIEGTYLGSSDSRLLAADTIIFLDIPPLLCLRRAVKRHIKYQGCSRPDIPDGCTDKLGLLYILKILVFPFRGRNQILAKIKEFRSVDANESAKKTILTYRSNEVLEGFLQGLAVQPQEEHTHERHGQMQVSALKNVAVLALFGA
ncbi:MAG: hypothetical protein ACJ8AG_11885 [Ktedonobacteraceae bacterium]